MELKDLRNFKIYLLDLLGEVIEPYFWGEVLNSEQLDGSYPIFKHDLPFIRDLKACINMLTAIERAWEKCTEFNSLMGVYLFKRYEVTADIYDFYQNLKVYMSTTSILSSYLEYLKNVSLKHFFPFLLKKMQELSKLCNVQNLERGADFIIEKVIALEQYQEKYSITQANPTPEKPDTSAAKSEGFITTLVKKNDEFLQKIYKEKYAVYFQPDKKLEEKKDAGLDYYAENSKDNETVKNIKLLFNGIIGIQKVLDDHEGYTQASKFGSVSWLPSFIRDLRRVYSSFQDFNHKAVIAEQSRPLAEYIKKLLKEINPALEEIACLVDKTESELCLREGFLLKYVKMFIERYTQITSELNISTDYVKQKNIFYKSRAQARKVFLHDIENQLEELKKFLHFQYVPLKSIPSYIINSMLHFFARFPDISMNQKNLALFKKTLVELISSEPKPNSSIRNIVEAINNRLGRTIQSEVMSALNNRALYLKKQKDFLEERFKRNEKFYARHPYTYFTPGDTSEFGFTPTILESLKIRMDTLALEERKLVTKGSKPHQSSPTESKEKPKRDKSPPKLMNDRQINLIKSKKSELMFFKSITKKFEETQTIESKNVPDNLGPESVILLSEISEILDATSQRKASSA